MDVIITMSSLMIAASILFLTSVYYQQKRDRLYRRQVAEKISELQRTKETRNQIISALKREKGVFLDIPVDETSEGDVKMFYKTKVGTLIDLNEIVSISKPREWHRGGVSCSYKLSFKGAPNTMWYIEKEDYEGIIKYLEIANKGDK